MKKERFILFVLFLIPAVSSYTFAIPETTITRTHLSRDIEESKITFGFGLELFKQDPEPAYFGELYYGYLGHARSDWLEYGIAIHSVYAVPSPFFELKFDLVDIFTDSSRLSCLVMGGIGGLAEDQNFYILYHGGGAVNFRLNPRTQLYVGAGSDSISQALNLQAGVYTMLLDWLGVSANFKLVTGPEGTEPMLSVAPLAVIQLEESESSDSKE